MKMASFKMYLFSVLSLVLGTIFSTVAQEHVPVLIWESSSADENDFNPGALSHMNVEDFADVVVRRMARNPVVILFSEEALSVEDFSRQNSGSDSSFPALQAIKNEAKLDYIPAVQTPIKALNRLSKLGYKWEHVSSDGLPGPGKKVLVVELGGLKDGEDRPSMMLRHDKYIASLFKQASTLYPDVLAIYTGHGSSWESSGPNQSRVRREAEPISATSPLCNIVLSSANSTDQIMLHTSECPVLKMNNTQFNLTSGTSDAPANKIKDGGRVMVVRYKLNDKPEKVNIRFKFNVTNDGYWQLTQATVEDSSNLKQYTLDAKSVIKAPQDFSYSCGSKAIFATADGNVTLELKNIRVQPGVQNGVFSADVNCVPFFTEAIWSGLFVTFILLFIVGWGIDMMMNIHTMDRFDDPKGKPLVFNAQE